MEPLKNNINNIKEKTKSFAAYCKNICINLFSQGISFLKKVGGDKRKILIVVIVIVVLAGGVFSYLYFFRWAPSVKVKDTETFATIKKGELVGTTEVGQKIKLGDLEITVDKIIEGTYQPLELDAEGKRITKKYWGAKIMVFNTSHDTDDIPIFGLIDDRKNQYERDPEIEFNLQGIRDFGPAKQIWLRTIREGYLLFPAPDEKAKKLQLIIFSDVHKGKVIYEMKR